MTACVILAAGASRRLGRPKQTVVLDGETLVERAVRVAVETGFEAVFVVVSAAADFTETLRSHGCVVVVNETSGEGVASSIRVGVARAQALQAAGVVVMVCDQVALTAEHLRQLTEIPARVTASAYAGRKGVPAYFPAAVFGELMELQGDAGARELLRDAVAVVDESLALDVDTEMDVVKARSLLTKADR